MSYWRDRHREQWIRNPHKVRTGWFCKECHRPQDGPAGTWLCATCITDWADAALRHMYGEVDVQECFACHNVFPMPPDGFATCPWCDHPEPFHTWQAIVAANSDEWTNLIGGA